MNLRRNRQAFEELCLFYRVAMPIVSDGHIAGSAKTDASAFVECQALLSFARSPRPGDECTAAQRGVSPVSGQPELARLPTVDDFWADQGSGRAATAEDQAEATDGPVEPVSVDEFWDAMLPNHRNARDDKLNLPVLAQEREAKRQKLTYRSEKQEHDLPLPANAEEAATDDDGDDDELQVSRRPRRSTRVSGRAGAKKREWWKATDTPEKPSKGKYTYDRSMLPGASPSLPRAHTHAHCSWPTGQARPLHAGLVRLPGGCTETLDAFALQASNTCNASLFSETMELTQPC